MPICENDHWSLAIIAKPYLAAQIIEKHVKNCKEGGKKATEKVVDDVPMKETIIPIASIIDEEDNKESKPVSGGGPSVQAVGV